MASPVFNCHACHRPLGAEEGHNLTDDLRIICYRCLIDSPLHPEWYPNCPSTWHDMFDHIRYVSGNRASVAMLLGYWRPNDQRKAA